MKIFYSIQLLKAPGNPREEQLNAIQLKYKFLGEIWYVQEYPNS